MSITLNNNQASISGTSLTSLSSSTEITAKKLTQSDERVQNLFDSMMTAHFAMDNQMSAKKTKSLDEYIREKQNVENRIKNICSLYAEIVKNPGLNSSHSIEQMERHMLALIKVIEQYDRHLEITLGKARESNSSIKSFFAKQFTDIRAATDESGSPAERVAVRVAEARLVSALGVGPKKTEGGATGSITYEGFDGKRIGIFKPKQENMNTKRKVEHSVKKMIGWNRQVFHCRNQGKIPAMYSEISASVADSYFGTNLVPATRFAKLNDLEGSFMIWSDNHKEAVDYKSLKLKEASAPLASAPEKTKETVEFQKMVVFDYLIGNLDRHNKNWIIQQDSKGTISSVKAIDNANAFLTSNPTSGGEDRIVRQKQYAWKSFPLAEKPFVLKDPEIKEIFNKLKDENCVDILIDQLRTELLKHNSGDEVNAFLSPEMREHLEQRIEVLKKLETCAPADYPITPQFLASLSTDEAINIFLEK